jgi:hypothetical protein
LFVDGKRCHSYIVGDRLCLDPERRTIGAKGGPQPLC